MYTQVEKPKENKSRAVANSVTQKKSNVQQCFGFVDNRPEAIAQMELQEISNNSPQAIQLNSSQVEQVAQLRVGNGVIQRVDIDGVDVTLSRRMPQWVQDGLTYHLNVTTDPSHVTCEDWPASTHKKKDRTTKMHFFFKGSQGSIVNAVSGQRGKKKFSDLPPAVQTFVNSNYSAILGVLRVV